MRRGGGIRAGVAIVISSAVLLSAAPAPAKAPKKQGAYGAIAINRESRAVGYAYDFKTAKEAKREALSQCAEQRCEVVATFKDGCAAVAAGGGRLAALTGITRDEAETKSLRKCGKGCTVLAWACSKQ